MELQAFTVPVPVDRAWNAARPQRIAPCMPGASFESVEGDAFTGNVKIKLGLIDLSYRGQAREEVTGSEAMRALNWTFTSIPKTEEPMGPVPRRRRSVGARGPA